MKVSCKMEKTSLFLCVFCEDDCDNSDSSQPGSFTQVSLQDNTSQASKNRKTIWMAEGRNKSLSRVKGLALKWLS